MIFPDDPKHIELPYRYEFQCVAIQAMSRWNRDPASCACGSFDRAWWGWKSRDFSDSTLQAAISLVLSASEDQGWDWMMPDLLMSYVRFVAHIQHADGSFDQCYPFERTPGVFYDILPALIDVYRSRWLSEPTRGLLRRVIQKGIEFALEHDEVHGEIVNHLAHFAYGLLLHWQAFDDERSKERAEYYIARVLRNFDADEGWFQEYFGPDPGYQTRTLAYLTQAAEILNDEAIWRVCAQAARFIELVLMPDGSLHPMLGVRSTALLYPSGFERLATHDPNFFPLALRVRMAWSIRSAPLPSQLDFGNALRLAEDAQRAAQIARNANASVMDGGLNANIINIPQGVTHLSRAGIMIRRDSDTILWCAWRLGGALVVWRKSLAGTWQLVFEDAGYLVDSEEVGKRWLTRMPGSGRLVEQNSNQMVLEADFHRALDEEVTPPKLLLLRVLNLTFLRSALLGDIFRRLLVRRLTHNAPPIPVKLVRAISFTLGQITVLDEFSISGSLARPILMAPMRRLRRMTGIHMASSRYYQPIEGSQVTAGAAQQVCSLGSASQIKIEIA